jgi:hypothetical protein
MGAEDTQLPRRIALVWRPVVGSKQAVRDRIAARDTKNVLAVYC